MTLDIATLFTVTVLIIGLGGLLLLFSWLQNRSSPALYWWGFSFLTFAPGIALFGLRGRISETFSIEAGNALLLLAYGLLWTGARAFEGRRLLLHWTVAGAAVWIAACQFDAFIQSLAARITLATITVIAYCALFIWELWQGRREKLVSRWPVMVMIGLHALIFVVRLPAIAAMPFPVGALPPSSSALTLAIFTPLFYSFALIFLLMSLARERAESTLRRAAAIDPLTGIPNRRGFGQRAERVVARARRGAAPLSLLLCDLDNFKSINDRFGHAIGDRTLVIFSRTISQTLRPLDLVGRVGGEEFVALLPDVGPDEVLQIAERVRDAFAEAARDVEGHPVGATVSIGTASAPQTGYDFDVLYAMADAALYRAKQQGRNRIELGSPARNVRGRGLATVVG